MKHNVERLPHRHTAFKRHKKRVNKLKVILHKLSVAIKRSRNLEKQRQKLLENDWKFLKNELVEEKREHQNNIDQLLTKNDRLRENEIKAKQELCLQNLKVLSIKTKKDALSCIEQYNEYVQNSKEREMEMRQTNEIQSYSDQHIDLSH